MEYVESAHAAGTKASGELKNMILYFTGSFLSNVGSGIYSFAIGLYILKITGSALNFALSMALGIVPRIILSPVAGTIADKFDRKKLDCYDTKEECEQGCMPKEE